MHEQAFAGFGMKLFLISIIFFCSQISINFAFGQTDDLYPRTATSPCSCTNCEAERIKPIRYLCDAPDCNTRNWIDLDYMHFFSDGFRVPQLVAGSAPGTPRANVGILGDPATTLLLGNERIGADSLSGLRLGFGRWLDDYGDIAITGSVFALRNADSVTFPGDATSIISRPFFNVDPAVDALDAELVNLPGTVDGTISVMADQDIFSGSIGLQKKLSCCVDRCNCSAKRVDGYIGYRAFAVDESLVVSERLSSSATGGLLPVGTRFDVVDRFETENRFHGVEFGILQSWQKKRWTLTAASRIALGNTRQRVVVDGSTTITVPTVDPFVQPYGILAGPTNIGTYVRHRFGVLTDARLEVGYQLTTRFKLNAGYNFIYLNSVARPGDHIDLNVNGTQIDPNVPVAGPNSPAFNWVEESQLLHGFNVGFEFIF